MRIPNSHSVGPVAVVGGSDSNPEIHKDAGTGAETYIFRSVTVRDTDKTLRFRFGYGHSDKRGSGLAVHACSSILAVSSMIEWQSYTQ